MPLMNICATFLPYCIQRQEDGRYAILNREYKPIGFWSYKHVKYEDYPVLVKIRSLTPKQATLISVHGKPETHQIYLVRPAEC